MWNCPTKPIPSRDYIEEAIYDLDCAMAQVFEEEGPDRSKVEAAFDAITGQRFLEEVYRRRFIEAMFEKPYDPATRFRACEAALDLLKRQIGCATWD